MRKFIAMHALSHCSGLTAVLTAVLRVLQSDPNMRECPQCKSRQVPLQPRYVTGLQLLLHLA